MKRDLHIPLARKTALPGNEKSSTLNTEKKTAVNTETFVSNAADDEENFEHLDQEFTAPVQPAKKKISFFGLIGKMLLLIVQALTALCLLPLGICTIVLAVFFGIEIYLVFFGSSVLGFALITLALMILISEIASLIWKLVGGSKRKLRSYGIRFLICAVLFGCGAVLSVKNIADFQIIESPMMTQNAVTRSYPMNIPEQSSSLYLSSSNIEIISDSSLLQDQILIHYTAPEAFHVENITQQDNNYYLHSWLEPSNEFAFIQQIIKTTFEGLKENILYQYTENKAVYVMIYVHPDSLHRITVNGWEVHFE